MSTSNQFYRERLGLSASNGYEHEDVMIVDGHTTGADFKTYGGYEESLSKFKGTVYTLNIYHLIGMYACVRVPCVQLVPTSDAGCY